MIGAGSKPVKVVGLRTIAGSENVGVVNTPYGNGDRMPHNTPNVNLHANIQSNTSKSNQAYFTQAGGGGMTVVSASAKKAVGGTPGMHNFSA